MPCFQTYTGSMDTIIYFFLNRETDNFITEKWKEDDYCLIRAGVPPFARHNEDGVKSEHAQDSSNGFEYQSREKQHNQLIRIWESVRNILSKKSRKQTKSDSGLGEWLTALRLLADNPNQIFCVYEDSLRKELEKEEVRKLWSAHWEITEFKDYREWKWAEKLIVHAKYHHYVILGKAPCVPDILYSYCRWMRSVRWLLTEEDFSVDVQEFLNDFYKETGLAIETELVLAEDTGMVSKLSEIDMEKSKMTECIRPYARVYLTASRPVNVIDFSGEEKISACGIPQGSIWLDMDSQEGKCRRMEVRTPGVHYFSLKQRWKQQKKSKKRIFTGKSPYFP